MLNTRAAFCFLNYWKLKVYEVSNLDYKRLNSPSDKPYLDHKLKSLF